MRGHSRRWVQERRAFDAFAKATVNPSTLPYGKCVDEIEKALAPFLAGKAPDSLWLAQLLLPATREMALVFARVTTYVRTAEALVAVRRWQINHPGEIATDLEAPCRDAKLPRVPIDPFSGRPIKFRRLGNDLLVYSIGQDGNDDVGLVDSMLGRKPKGDLIFRLPIGH